MDNAKKLELLADLFELDANELAPETKLDEMEEWDSMAKLALIVFMDDECSKALTGDIIRGFKIVQDILDFMG